jgi:hypothetical protein
MPGCQDTGVEHWTFKKKFKYYWCLKKICLSTFELSEKSGGCTEVGFSLMNVRKKNVLASVTQVKGTPQ